MVIDRLIEQIKNKKNPCIVGIDPEWSKIPECYITNTVTEAENILHWATDVIDAVADIVPAVKPQMAFFEVFGAEGVRVHQQVIQYAHNKGLVVVDDSKKNDIGNTIVPGFGAQGGEAKDIVPCFNEDGLGAIVSSSRGILYKHLDVAEYDGTKNMYVEIVKNQAKNMQQLVYKELSRNYPNKEY